MTEEKKPVRDSLTKRMFARFEKIMKWCGLDQDNEVLEDWYDYCNQQEMPNNLRIPPSRYVDSLKLECIDCELKFSRSFLIPCKYREDSFLCKDCYKELIEKENDIVIFNEDKK